MEQLSIFSFLSNGHDYHLYIYDDVKHVPVGTLLRDGNEILPSSRIFQYKRSPSYAGFSNYFRYKLLLERGGWWADTDTICLRPFDFKEEYVFSSEINDSGREVVNSGVIKAAAASRIMAYTWGVCQTKNPTRLAWGETGPRLMNKAVKKFSLERYKKSHRAFCPINYQEWRTLLQPCFVKIFDDDTYAVHLWNEMWRAAGQDKDARYPETCLYERLKRDYLPDSLHSQCPEILNSDII